MKNVYFENEPAQGTTQTEPARDAISSPTVCTKAFDPESARLGDTDDACEVAGG